MNLLLSMYDIDVHAQVYMNSLGISYKRALPQSVTDSWCFYGCENVPRPLPKGVYLMKDQETK